MSDMHLIWSGEHHAWWRRSHDGEGCGYTTNIDLAGRWQRAAAERITSHCGPDKRIVIQPAPVDGCGAWLILFDDKGVPPEVFSGPDAKAAAAQRFEAVSTGYNCHLFQKVRSA